MIEVNKNGIQIEKTPDVIRCTYYIGEGQELEMFFDSSKEGMKMARSLTLEDIAESDKEKINYDNNLLK